jgi:hypothetical protein
MVPRCVNRHYEHEWNAGRIRTRHQRRPARKLTEGPDLLVEESHSVRLGCQLARDALDGANASGERIEAFEGNALCLRGIACRFAHGVGAITRPCTPNAGKLKKVVEVVGVHIGHRLPTPEMRWWPLSCDFLDYGPEPGLVRTIKAVASCCFDCSSGAAPRV